MGAYLQATLDGIEIWEKIGFVLVALGSAAVFGGFFHQLKEKSKDVTNGMFQGALIQLVGGALLLILAIVDDVDLKTTHWVYFVIIPVAIAGLAFYKRNARKSDPLVWGLLGLLSAAALCLGLFW